MFPRIGVAAAAVMFAIVAVVALSAPPAEAVGSFCLDDPIGDFIPMKGQGPKTGPLGGKGPSVGPPDIVEVCVTNDESDLTLLVSFNEIIQPPSPIGPGSLGGFRGAQGLSPINAVAGYIDFDEDQDSGTGVTSNVTEFCPDPSSMGIEAFLSLFDYDDVAGTVGLYDAEGEFIAAVPISFDPQAFTVVIPLSDLGGDAALNFGMVLGNASEPTDCFPGDGGFVTVKQAPPTPTSTEPAPTPTSAIAPTGVGPTATVTALPQTGAEATGSRVLVMFGLLGASAAFACAASVLAVRRRRT